MYTTVFEMKGISNEVISNMKNIWPVLIIVMVNSTTVKVRIL
jgi:hypothetical protein